MVVMIVLAQLYGVLQVAVLGWGARSARLRTVLAAVAVGFLGVSVATLLVQLAWTTAWVALTGTSRLDVTRVASYTVDPWIEEVAKLAPVAVAWWLLTAVRRSWGVTDLTLAAGAVGAGFGLAEQLLRFGSDAGRAFTGGWDGWTLPGGIFWAVHVPGPGTVLGSWLPAGAASREFLGGAASDGIDIHLAWSLVAGLGLALLLRSRTQVPRLVGVALVAFAGLDHAAHNASGAAGDVLQGLVAPLDTLRDGIGFFAFAAVVAAVVVDRRELAAHARTDDLLLAAERGAARTRDAAAPPGDATRAAGDAPAGSATPGATTATDAAARPRADVWTSAVGLTRLAVARLPWSFAAVTGFVRLRRAHAYAVAAGHPSDELRAGAAVLRDALDAADGPRGRALWADVSRRQRERWSPRAAGARLVALTDRARAGGTAGRAARVQLVVGVLAVLLLGVPVAYYVVGGTRTFAVLQDVATWRPVVWFLVGAAALAVALSGVLVVRGVRGLRADRSLPVPDLVALRWYALLTRSGAVVVGVVAVVGVLRGADGDDRLVRTWHILDALGDALLVMGLVIAVAGLFLFPPFGGLALAGGGMVLTTTITAELLGTLALGGVVGLSGVMLSQAAGSTGEGGSSGGSSGSSGSSGSGSSGSSGTSGTQPTGSAGGTPTGPRTNIPRNANPELRRSLQREQDSADRLADLGYRVEQNPHLPGTSRNPDFRIEGRIFDNYAPTRSNPRSIWSEIQGKVTEGQTSRVVLNLDDSAASMDALRTQFTRWPIEGLDEVMVLRGGQVLRLFP